MWEGRERCISIATGRRALHQSNMSEFQMGGQEVKEQRDEASGGGGGGGEERERSLLRQTEVHCGIFSSRLSSAPSCRPPWTPSCVTLWCFKPLTVLILLMVVGGWEDWGWGVENDKWSSSNLWPPAPMQKQHNALICFPEC